MMGIYGATMGVEKRPGQLELVEVFSRLPFMAGCCLSLSIAGTKGSSSIGGTQIS